MCVCVCVHLRSAAEGVEHVKEDKAGEGHSGVPWGDDPVLHLETEREGGREGGRKRERENRS